MDYVTQHPLMHHPLEVSYDLWLSCGWTTNELPP
jgi:hypothetical protein